MNQKKECMDVHVNGLKFHVQTFGSGVPIIMIMGLGAPGDKWKHNYELLSKWFWCIVPDNRGAGLSDKPEAESYTTEQMAADIIGIMDALDIKKAERRYRSGSIKAVESLDDLWPIHADTSPRED